MPVKETIKIGIIGSNTALRAQLLQAIRHLNLGDNVVVLNKEDSDIMGLNYTDIITDDLIALNELPVEHSHIYMENNEKEKVDGNTIDQYNWYRQFDKKGKRK